MLKHVAVTSAAVVLIGWSAAQAGGHGGNCCPCPCGAGVAAVNPAPDAVPPAAPAQGATAQSQSIEPQSSPPAAPATGVTTRSYSIQPAPAYRIAPQASRARGLYDPGRRLHPTNHMYYPNGY